MRIKRRTSNTITKPSKDKLLIEHPQMDAIIKSARVFEKDEMVYIDYRVNPLYKKDGKERTRFSTGERAGKRTMLRVEREKFQRAREHYLVHTQVLDESSLTVDDIALDAINEDRGNRQDDTHNDYLKIYEVYIKPFFAKKILREIKVTDIKRWKDYILTQHRLSRSRYEKFHRTLNFIFKYALENEMIDRNPATFVSKKSKLFTVSKKSQSVKYYTSDEVDRMITHSEGWFKVLLVTYLNTGMRTGEGLALQWSDIDFEKNTILIQRSMRKGQIKESTKTGIDRIVRLPKPLKEELLAYRDVCNSDVWIFPNPKTGRPYYEANSITKWYFKPLLKKCGIEYKTFYALRHTFASLAVQQNIPMNAVQQQLGHSKLSTTLDFYVKNDLLNDDANSDIFDKLFAS